MRTALTFILHAQAYPLTPLAGVAVRAGSVCPLQWPHQPVAHS